MTPIRILELRSVVGAGGGPEKTIMLGTAGADPAQFAITVCYIRDLRDSAHDLGARAAALKVDYVEIAERHSFDWRVWPQLQALCRDRRIELVHSHDYKTDLLAWMLARRLGVKALATAHAWVGHSWRERRVYYPGDKWLLSRFERVIAVSGEIRDELIRTGTHPSRVQVVLNGIDAARFRRDPDAIAAARAELNIGPHDVVIGAVGRLEPQKRFDLLIEAAAALRLQHPSLRVVIAGDGSLRGELTAHIARAGVQDTVRLLGHHRNIPRLHHALDLLVQTSDYEGTPNVVLEAMALGTPVVATAAGGTAELLEDGVHGVVIPCGSATTVRDAVDGMLRDSAARRRLAASARRRVEGPLSFTARMRAVEAVYLDLCRPREERSAVA
jgi:glycosyltransferase involved in cell wall biosynthesis